MNNIYNINKQINVKIGATADKSTTFELVKEQVKKLGGDVTKVVDIRTGEEQVLQHISGGSTANIQTSKDVNITENGITVVNPDEGYDAIKTVNVNVDVATGGTFQMLGTNPGFRGNMPSIEGISFPELASCESMFQGCTALTTVPQFDTSNVTDMSSMFQGCTALTTVSQFDTSNVTDMSSMFYGCTALTTVPNFSATNKLTNCNNMFYNCFKLESVEFSGLPLVTKIDHMFYACTKIKSIKLGNLSKVESLSANDSYYKEFTRCNSLEELYFDNLGYSFTKQEYLDLSDCNNLSDTAIQNILDGVANLSSKSFNCYITFPDAIKNKITSAQKTALNKKKWYLD